jgi:DNA (cytosine-5)-methyltransferase 1
MYTTPEESKFLNASMDRYVANYEKASYCINPRDLYPAKPARTLTCRNLAGATGDMQRVKLKDGKRRRLLHREAARLQSFPDWFEFQGNETQRFNQIGNAVPPLLAYKLALALKDCFYRKPTYTAAEIAEKAFSPNKELTLLPA